MNSRHITRFFTASVVLLLAVAGSHAARAAEPEMDPEVAEVLCGTRCALASADCVARNNSPEYCTAFYAGCYSSCRLF